ncbi:MAG: RnfH family protein [Candidatus Competibacteraceae bacterium]|nr:RnfH family protein [Candidatus Competibacteraceae bacterium]
MHVGVVYADMRQQILLNLEVPEGSTVQHAIECSGILARCPEVNLKKNKIGIYGKIAKVSTLLSEGDRVEIYTPIMVDPKTIPQRKVALDDEDED